MTCLNLPPEERCREENIYFVSVLPGRKQQTHLDGILTPLVSDLLEYWGTGVYFTGLPGIPEPHLVRCALVQIICDLPAARRIAGFPGHSATCLCSVCFSVRQNISDTASAYDRGLRRTLEDHMVQASEYRSMLETHGRRSAESLLKANPRAVRWSPLNELPYWNPMQCTVIDAMHLILIGLCQHHWRKFWGGDQIPERPRDALESTSTRQENGITVNAVQNEPTSRLIPHNFPDTHQDHPNRHESEQEPHHEQDEEFHDGGIAAGDQDAGVEDELDQIQEDIKNIIVPSWFSKPGPRFGRKSNGRVKAAEWQGIFSVYLPMTLLRIWIIEMKRGNSTDLILHLKALLCLSIIVDIAISRTSSSAMTQLYAQSVKLYLRLITRLNEDQPLVPNHHLALHLHEFMELHGPSRSHWAFPFERAIGKLHKISHNSKIGEQGNPSVQTLTRYRGYTYTAVPIVYLGGNAQVSLSARDRECKSTMLANRRSA
ncbi:hypothetical protein CPB86DRAFT_713508 [Serendipita vermifera]|nr:hypothetical protein CPB86DRAFT_713508 [Serendipita vermifera]